MMNIEYSGRLAAVGILVSLAACAAIGGTSGRGSTSSGGKADGTEDNASSCIFADTTRALLRSPAFAVGAKGTIASAEGLSDLTAEQILKTFGADYQVETVAEAIESTDDHEIYRRELQHLQTGQTFTFLYAWGGENQFGWIFRAGTTEVVARDGDESIYDCTVPAIPGDIDGGECASHNDCAEGSLCRGIVNTASWPEETALGLCAVDAEFANAGDYCEADVECDAGLFCGGIDTGCLPTWMRRRVASEDGVEIQPASKGDLFLAIRGLATVIVTASLDLEISTNDATSIRVGLETPCHEEISVFDGTETPGIEFSETGLVAARLDVTTCTDDQANGRYVLRIDNGGADVAFVEAWSVTASSRWD